MNLTRYFLLLFYLLLAGCGTLGGKPAQTPAEPVAKPTSQIPAPTTSKPGGYYLDDGPGDNPPPDIDAIPDAVPRPEAFLARANRPYKALGESYTPMTTYQPYRAQGVASWYGKRYHGNKTSSGEIYDMYGMTAAHPTLPLPSYVRVTNPETSRSVVVRVNDRGPFHKERLIDLSYAAAYKLRLIGRGSGQVVVEAIDTRPQAEMPQQKPPELTPAELTARAMVRFIQVGAFRSKDNAEQLMERLQKQNFEQNAPLRNWYNNGVYRVRMGPYANPDDAERAAAEIRHSLGISDIVITQQETP